MRYEQVTGVNENHSTQEDRGAELITAERLARYRRTGFLVVPGLFSGQQILALREWTEDLQRWPEAPGKYMMYFEQSDGEPATRLLNRVENFVPHHEGFRALVYDKRLLAIASMLMGGPVVLFKDKINFKLPGGGGFEPHQDAQAGWQRYASLHLTAMISIDRSTRDNGCLEMAAGFHDRGLIGDEWAPLTEAETGGMCFEPVETEPGDAVFFDSFAPHCSAPNHTDHPRRVLYISYNRESEGDSRDLYYADKRRSYPPDIEREQGRLYRYRV